MGPSGARKKKVVRSSVVRWNPLCLAYPDRCFLWTQSGLEPTKNRPMVNHCESETTPSLWISCLPLPWGIRTLLKPFDGFSKSIFRTQLLSLFCFRIPKADFNISLLISTLVLCLSAKSVFGRERWCSDLSMVINDWKSWRLWRRRHRSGTTLWGKYLWPVSVENHHSIGTMSSSPRSSSSLRYHEVQKKEREAA